MADFQYLTASEILERIKMEQVSAKEVLTSLINRIKSVNGSVNAIVQLDETGALSQAEAIDKQLRAGKNAGPLAGLPITIKDNIEVSGMITTGGILGRKDYVPTYTAPVVQRLRDAGAIILGKTNCPPFCAGFETENDIYGLTKNPYDISKTVGSSSGGEAAIIAAGGSYLGIGSDSGGSMRWPSHFCGITSLVPTFGRVPRTGTIPPYFGFLDTTQIGPMARSVKDLSLILPIIMGPDNSDSRCMPLSYHDPEIVSLEKLSIAYYTDNGFVEPHKTVKQVISKAVESLEKLDLDLEEKYPPATHEFYDVGGGLNRFSANIDRDTIPEIREWEEPIEMYPDKIYNLADSWLAKAKTAKGDGAMLGLEFYFWSIKWDTYRSKILQFMKKYDAIICPISAIPAFPHGESSSSEFNPLELLSYTHPYSLVGLPSVALSGGTTNTGLPIGFQVISNHGNESLILKLGSYLEEMLGGFQPPSL
ncbi:MAG: hypothetical protein BAJATHORv1_30265 [Candidatus Thorarchaeota archaeon]|nr:MAG: hypothetical protein BAJATHORv1_30265 [Candidatus Thorarchaeota archaeon]